MDEFQAWRTLYELQSGMTSLPMIRSFWPEDHIDFLEDQGCIQIRSYDGEIKVTSSGVAALHFLKSFSKGGTLQELNPRLFGEL
ncbi:MAG: hypothetical protein U5L00_11385 [Desulfovermiculus sp.]|nr:hypothetical protein [Desulfovermiculus sp.]